eukprot:5892658-Alexandrium_andersonii.AAC.1
MHGPPRLRGRTERRFVARAPVRRFLGAAWGLGRVRSWQVRPPRTARLPLPPRPARGLPVVCMPPA